MSHSLRALMALGNPGGQYLRSRHNLGFLALDHLAERERVSFRREGPVELGLWRPAGLAVEILLAKPLTYMNRSGAGVHHLRRRHEVEAPELLVVLDDIDLPFGKLRLRARGGAGTHNGMRSVLSALGDEGFARLRLGVGPAPQEAELSEWVLEDFSGEEQQALPAVLDRAADCLVAAVRNGVRAAMNDYNSAG
ncbi:MAG: aminoacyl-tRNA hydrolase [bacterium]